MEEAVTDMVSIQAADQRKGLTLGELWDLCQRADAAGIDPREPVIFQVGFRGQLKTMAAVNPPSRKLVS